MMRSPRSAVIQCAVFAGVIWLLWRGFAATERGGNEDWSAIKEPKERAEAIKRGFVHGWNGYVKHAFPHDMLRPLSNTVVDDR